MVARGTFRSPTICAVRGILDHADRVPEYAVEKARQIEADSKKSHRTAIRAGVRPVCGTDAGTPFNPHGSAPQEIVFMVEWGMPPLDALRAATANGAELLRLADVGTIEAGKRADLLLVDGDPVEDPRALLGRRYVWQAGTARLAIAEDPLQDLDALAQRGELGGGEGGEGRPQGLDPSRATPSQRPARRSAWHGPAPPSRHPGRPPGPRVRPERVRPPASSSWAARPARSARARRSASGRRTPGPKGRRGAGQRCPAPRPPRAGAARGGSRPNGAGPPPAPPLASGKSALTWSS